jgi:hypothetical protein
MGPVTRTRWALVGGGVLFLALGGFALLDHVLERALRAPVDAYLANRTLNLLRVEGSTGLSILLPDLDLNLVRRRLELRDVHIRYDRKSEGRYTRFEAVAPTITLSGLDLSDLIWHRNFRLSDVRLRYPVIRHVEEGPPDFGVSTPSPSASDDTLAVVFPAPDTLLYRVVAYWLPADASGGRINHLIVDHATFVNRIQRGKVTTLDSTADLALAIEGLQLDSTRQRVFERGTLTLASQTRIVDPAHDTVLVEHASIVVGLEDTAYTIASARTGLGGKRHNLRLVGLTRSQARNTLTIDSLLYAPRESDQDFFRGAGERTTRVRIAAAGITLSALRQDDIRKRRVTPATIGIASMALDVLADQRPPPGAAMRHPPGAPTRRVHWPARLAALSWTFGSDTVTLSGGSIRYGELRRDQPQVAKVLFDRLRATITNATNDTALAGARTPMMIRAQAWIYGQGRLDATIAVAVQPGPLAARVDGRLGAMPFTAFNQFLTPANGIQITSGAIERAEFTFRISGGIATGSFSADYHDLDLSMVNSVTRKQNLGAKLKTFVAGLMIRGSSQRDRQGTIRPAPINHELQPDDSFWGILWKALRSGIVKQIKR